MPQRIFGVKNIILLISSLLFFNIFAFGSYIKAYKVPGDISEINAASRAWMSADFYDIVLYLKKAPERDCLNDSKEQEKIQKAKVKALSDGKNIAFLIKWKDDTKSIQRWYTCELYADRFSVQFPIDFEDPSKLPRIDGGDSNRAVLAYVGKAAEKSYYSTKDTLDSREEDTKKVEQDIHNLFKIEREEIFISKGQEKRHLKKDGSISGKTDVRYKKESWKGSLVRSLKDECLDLDKGAFPVSFLIYDGDKKEGSVKKYVSGWVPVKITQKSGGEKLIKELSAKVVGNADAGEKIALKNCAACHWYKDVKIAPEFMAPDLSRAGGYFTEGYLRESILHPHAVIALEQEATINKNFPWQKDDGFSTMPVFDWMSEKDIDDLIAFLQSLLPHQ